MENRQVKRENVKIISALIILMLILSCLFSIVTPFNVLAESEIEYTSVLEDLEKDENFNIEEYPVIEENYSLQVIQIAESEDNELFIYVYQPSGQVKDLRAKYINMSLTDSVEDTSIYTLTFINSENTLFKYVVDDVMVNNSQELRNYNITSIYRKFIEGVDENSDYIDQSISYTALPVAKLFVAHNEGNEVLYNMYDTEVLRIDDKYTGFVRYYGGFSLFENHDCDSHFVAFSTDRKIDTLLSAKVHFNYQSFYDGYYLTGGIVNTPVHYQEYGTILSKEVILNYDEKIDYTGNGWWAPTYKWKRIQTVSEFFNSVEDNEIFDYTLFNVSVESTISKENKEKLSGMDYVLRFYETPYDYDLGVSYTITKTIVSDVSILELTFETEGKVYRIGVVDNMQSGPDEPFNDTNVNVNVSWWVWLILAIIVLCIIGVFFPFVFTFLWFCIKGVFKGIWYLITAPFSIFSDNG